jgi:integrase/recombinase XerD
LLKRYFIRPTTVDRVRASWLGEAIEGYVVWLTEQKYAARNMAFRVPVLVRFGEFVRIPRDGDQRSELMSITIPK